MKTDDRREGWLAGFHAEHANSTRTAETKTQTRIRRLASRVRMESTSRINKDRVPSGLASSPSFGRPIWVRRDDGWQTLFHRGTAT